MDNIKNYFKNLNRNQIIAIIVTISVIVLTLILTGIKIYSSSLENQNVAGQVDTTTEECISSETVESTTQCEDETESIADTTTTTKKYIAKTDVKVSVASGNKVKDEDKGNAHIDVAKPSKKPATNITEPQTNPLPSEPQTNAPLENIDADKKEIFPAKDKIKKSKYSKYKYIDTDNNVGWFNTGSEKYYLDNNSKPLTGLQKISNRYYHFNDNGALASLVGIDVSSWNKEIDWKKVKADGIDYAILRVGFRGYGTEGEKPPLLDKMIEQNLKGAKEAGVDIGLYFFSQAITVDEALEEAGVCINAAKGYKISYPIYFDTEYATTSYSGRADGLSIEERTNIAVAFCEAIKNAGYTPGVYASRNFFYQNLDCSRLSKYQIWVAHYTDAQTNYKNKYEMWQYSSSAKVDGIEDRTDINISYYDYKHGCSMKNNGKTTILTDSSGFNLYLDAENAMDSFLLNQNEDSYNIAKDKINALPNENVKAELIAKLILMSKGQFVPDETTTMPPEDNTESTTETTTQKDDESTTNEAFEESTTVTIEEIDTETTLAKKPKKDSE